MIRSYVCVGEGEEGASSGLQPPLPPLPLGPPCTIDGGEGQGSISGVRRLEALKGEQSHVLTEGLILVNLVSSQRIQPWCQRPQERAPSTTLLTACLMAAWQDVAIKQAVCSVMDGEHSREGGITAHQKATQRVHIFNVRLISLPPSHSGSGEVDLAVPELECFIALSKWLWIS
eukprot:1157375-Pelagomonas_calceolata.AAC.13